MTISSNSKKTAHMGATCVALLLQIYLSVASLALLVLCFLSAQALLLLALLHMVFPRLLSDILADFQGLVVDTTPAPISREHGICVVSDTINVAQTIKAPKDSVDVECIMLLDIKSHHAKDERYMEARTSKKSPLGSELIRHGSGQEEFSFGLANATGITEGNPGMVRKRQQHLNKSIRNRRSENKENELPSPACAYGDTQFAGSPRRSGLKPLTLTLTDSPSRKDGCTIVSRQTTSLVKLDTESLSSVHEKSRKNRDLSHSNPTENISARNSTSETSLLSQNEDLAAKLCEEENLVKGLRLALEDLQQKGLKRDRDLALSKQQYLDLQAIAEARDFIIKVLCANITGIQTGEAAWRQAAWLHLHQKLADKLHFVQWNRQAEERIHKILWQARMAELGHKWIFRRFKEQLKRTIHKAPAPLDDQLDHPVGPVASWTVQGRVGTMGDNNKRTTKDCQVGPHDSILNPTALVHGIDNWKRNSSPTLREELQDNHHERGLGVMFPTISSRLPPCYAAARTSGEVSSLLSPLRSPQVAVIYEVDGRALAACTKERHGTTPLSASHAITNNTEGISPTLEGRHIRGNPQRDSSFYALPASTFVLPSPISPSAQDNHN